MSLDFSRKPAGFNTVTKKREYERLAAALLERGESVCRHLYPAGRKEGPEWCVGSVNGEKGHSFKINLKTGICKEFDGDGPGGGDMIAVWALARGIKAHAAYDEAVEWLGWGTSKPKTQAAWVQMATPAQQRAAENVTRELLDIAQQPRTDTLHDDEGASFREKWNKARLTDKWEYFDENGELLVTVMRKDFDGSKHIRPWHHKLEDYRWMDNQRPLFNLQGIKASSGPVILVEGEKCAKALIERGYTATTIAGGASASRVADWTPLRGRNVIRWADNDAAGAKWSEATRACLEAVGVRTVRDVALPAGKPEGWDCADATDAEIGALIRGAGAAPRSISAGDLKLPPLASIPKRRFIYGNSYQRGTITVTAGIGGSGKSALHVVEAIAIATGRDLLKTGRPIERCVFWMIALEDDENEMHRRIGAALMHYDIDPSEIEGWLRLTTKANAPNWLLAMSDRNGTQISAEAVADMKAEIIEYNIGAVSLDPYVYAHMTNENDNSAQAAVMSALVSIFSETNAACALVHHAKKPSSDDRGGPAAGDIRGAGAIVNSARHGRLVNAMSAAEAEKLDVPDNERFFYFRLSSVKANYSPPGDRSGNWFKMHGVRLPNGEQDEEGDGVGVVTKWEAPDVFEVLGVTVEKLRAVQADVERAYKAGAPYRFSAASKTDPWIGEAIGAETSLDPMDKQDRSKITLILGAWLKSRALVVDAEWRDAGRQKRKVIRVGTSA